MNKIFKKHSHIIHIDEFCKTRDYIEPAYNNVMKHTGIFLTVYDSQTGKKRSHRFIGLTEEIYCSIYGYNKNIVQFKKQVEEIEE